MVIVTLKNTLPGHLGVFILSICKRNWNNFIRDNNGFYNNNIYNTYTDSLYIEKKHSDVLDKSKLVREKLC